MLRSQDRLRSKEVEEVFKKGHRIGSPFFSLVFFTPVDRMAFAVTVTKKVAKNATDRNKIRRRVYEVLSKIKNYQTIAHTVLLPKKETMQIPFDVLSKEIKNILTRANIIK